MTQEEKQLLLIDLSARLVYGIKVSVPIPSWIKSIEHSDEPIELIGINIIDNTCTVGNSYSQTSGVKMFNRFGELICKPYLRPMSSMTEEEENKYNSLNAYEGGMFPHTEEAFDWLNAHHFDYRGLIEKGLALEAPKDLYLTK